MDGSISDVETSSSLSSLTLLMLCVLADMAKLHTIAKFHNQTLSGNLWTRSIRCTFLCFTPLSLAWTKSAFQRVSRAKNTAPANSFAPFESNLKTSKSVSEKRHPGSEAWRKEMKTVQRALSSDCAGETGIYSTSEISAIRGILPVVCKCERRSLCDAEYSMRSAAI